MITVELPDGQSAPIEHLSVDEARVTLGMSSCPSGQADNLFTQEKDKTSLGLTELMKSKAMEWAGQAKSSKLHLRDIHFCVNCKFWPKVKYGLCANSDSYDSLVQAMWKPYYLLCLLGGVVRSAKQELRWLDTGFYRVGLPHWGIEEQ